MKNILTIFKKEFKSYFNSPMGYIFIIVYLSLTNWLFFQSFFLVGQADMRSYFEILPWAFLFFVPAITMRLWAEEKKTGTIEILFTLPVKISELVIGKFLASFAFLGMTILLSFTLPITIKLLGKPDIGSIVCSYIGTLFLGASYLALGSFISAFTKNQIVAFILSVTISFFLLIVGESMVLFSIPKFLVPIFSYISLSSHFESISRGVIDSRDIIYYLSIISLFLILNINFLESKKVK
ncbi:MAG: ABC transporter permease subunit [bacterium]